MCWRGLLYRGAGATGYKPNTRPLRRRRNEPAVLQLAVPPIHDATDGWRSPARCPEHALSRRSAGEACLSCQDRVYPIGTARSPLLHDILGQAAGLRQMVLVPGRDDTAFAHLLVRAML
jgi:hypothetical protein